MLLAVSVRVKRLVPAPVAAFHVKVVVYAAIDRERFAEGFDRELHAGVEDIDAVVADVILPLASTVRTGTEVDPPYTAAVTPDVVRVVAKLPVPLPVTSPVNVIRY